MFARKMGFTEAEFWATEPSFFLDQLEAYINLQKLEFERAEAEEWPKS